MDAPASGENASGENHDVEFPVLGTLEGLHIHRPNALNAEGIHFPVPSQSSQKKGEIRLHFFFLQFLLAFEGGT